MANSPLILSGSGDRLAVDKSKLSATAASSNGATPEPQPSNGAHSGRDLAEQMNEEEKLKYIKGKLPALRS